jgi:hypothetical protein
MQRAGTPHGGALLVVSAALFLYTPQINAFARMDNAYLGNGLIGLFLILFGMTLVIGSLADYGVPAWLAALLWLASVAFYWFGLSWLTRLVLFPHGEILLYAALVVGGVLLCIVAHGYLAAAGIALLLISGGVALAWRLAGGDLRATSSHLSEVSVSWLAVRRSTACRMARSQIIGATSFILHRAGAVTPSVGPATRSACLYCAGRGGMAKPRVTTSVFCNGRTG